jgi:hypothetical protein
VQQRCRCQGAGAGQGAGAEAEAEAKAEAERVSRGANRTRNVSNATAARTLGGSWKGSRADVTACMCVGVCGWVVTRIQYTIHTLSIITSSHQPKKVTFHKIIRRAHMIRGGGPETPDGRGLEWTGLDSTQLNSTQLDREAENGSGCMYRGCTGSGMSWIYMSWGESIWYRILVVSLVVSLKILDDGLMGCEFFRAWGGFRETNGLGWYCIVLYCTVLYRTVDSGE